MPAIYGYGVEYEYFLVCPFSPTMVQKVHYRWHQTNMHGQSFLTYYSFKHFVSQQVAVLSGCPHLFLLPLSSSVVTFPVQHHPSISHFHLRVNGNHKEVQSHAAWLMSRAELWPLSGPGHRTLDAEWMTSFLPKWWPSKRLRSSWLDAQAQWAAHMERHFYLLALRSRWASPERGEL